MNLTAVQEDALTEVINIGFGRAAASLSKLTGQRVQLEVPHIAMCPLDELSDRLRPMMETLSRPEVLIGHVLAHEIGHKLLRTDSHSPTGLMKAHWSNVETEQMTFQPMTFTPADAAQIRENLAGGCRLLAAAAGPIAN